MRRALILAVGLVSSVAMAEATAKPVAPVAPVAKKERHVTKIHGTELVDDYFWMRQKGTPSVETYLKAEESYANAKLQPMAQLEAQLFEEMKQRVPPEDSRVPVLDGAYFYYRRVSPGDQYGRIGRKPAPPNLKTMPGHPDQIPGAEEVVLDLEALAKQEKFFQLGQWDVTDDHKTIAYSVDTTGFRRFTLYTQTIGAKTPPRKIAEATTTAAWSAGASGAATLFYTVESESAKRSYRLYRAAPGKTDGELVYEEKDEDMSIMVGRSRTKRFLQVQIASLTRSEVWLLDATKPTDKWIVVAPRLKDEQYYVQELGDELFILTDGVDPATGKKAVNRRLVKAPLAKPSRENWREVIAHRSDVFLQDAMPMKDALVTVELNDGSNRLVLIDWKTKQQTVVPMPEVTGEINLDWAGLPTNGQELPLVRLTFSSMLRPDSTYDYVFATKQLELRKAPQLPTYDPARFEVTRVVAKARDGVNVAIDIAHKRGIKPKAGGYPIVMYGYGSYGISSIGFDARDIAIFDHDVLFARVQARGGNERGKPWHDAGRLMNKLNTFYDFIDATEFLIKANWANPKRIAAYGASAGGLLMGAITNLRPDLWHAVVARVPFVDVMNTMLDASLPLTVGEYEEWGNPNEKPAFDYMLKYSPYDNVTKRAYPNMLVISAYNDSQVMYWEPAKYVAKMRALKTDKNDLLFKINMEPSGHSGKSGRYEYLRVPALVDAYLIWMVTK